MVARGAGQLPPPPLTLACTVMHADLGWPSRLASAPGVRKGVGAARPLAGEASDSGRPMHTHRTEHAARGAGEGAGRVEGWDDCTTHSRPMECRLGFCPNFPRGEQCETLLRTPAIWPGSGPAVYAS